MPSYNQLKHELFTTLHEVHISNVYEDYSDTYPHLNHDPFPKSLLEHVNEQIEELTKKGATPKQKEKLTALFNENTTWIDVHKMYLESELGRKVNDKEFGFPF